MKKIMILIDQLNTHGGIEKLVALKANYWSEKWGWDIMIVSTEQQGLPFVYTVSKNVKHEDLNINYRRESSFFHPKNIFKLIKNYIQLKSIVKSYEPDFILVSSHIPMTYLLPFLKTKAKTVKEFHFSKFNQQKNFKEKIFNKIESKYDFQVVLTKEEENFYLAKNTVVIPNPANLSKFKIHPLHKRENVAIAILRFAPVKQIEKMIEAWEIFYKKNQDWRFHIFGETGNEYYQYIKKMVDKKNLSECIIFKGQSSNIEQELESSKFLLLTSKNECFPMVILEAFSCGTPVISFDSPTGPRNIIKHQLNGILVEQDNTLQFANEMDFLANNNDQWDKMSREAISTSKNYSEELIMDNWKKFIFEKL